MAKLKNAKAGKIMCGIIGAVMIMGACQNSLSTDNAPVSAVPSSTRSQQQIELDNLEMRYYYDTYKDEYAALVLREMFEAGELTEEEYCGVYAAAGNALSSADIKEYHKISDILNCRLTHLSQKDLLKCRLIITEKIKSSPVMISLFDLPDQRDEVESAIKLINEWAGRPDNSNTKKLENELVSGSLSCGARVYLYYYVCGISSNIEAVEFEGEKYDPAYYIESRMSEWFSDALSELLKQNNQ